LHPIIQIPHAASVGMSQDRFLALLTMFYLNNSNARQLRDSQIMTHYSKFGQLFTHSTQNFRTSTHQKNI
jgi:hypothetical protein